MQGTTNLFRPPRHLGLTVAPKVAVHDDETEEGGECHEEHVDAVVGA